MFNRALSQKPRLMSPPGEMQTSSPRIAHASIPHLPAHFLRTFNVPPKINPTGSRPN